MPAQPRALQIYETPDGPFRKGSILWKTTTRKAAFWHDWSVFALAFSVIANRWATEFRNFELILARLSGVFRTGGPFGRNSTLRRKQGGAA